MWRTMTEGMPDRVLSARPAGGTWSAMEYAAHSRDITEAMGRLLHYTLTTDHPRLDGPPPEAPDPTPAASMSDAITELDQNVESPAMTEPWTTGISPRELDLHPELVLVPEQRRQHIVDRDDRRTLRIFSALRAFESNTGAVAMTSPPQYRGSDDRNEGSAFGISRIGHLMSGAGHAANRGTSPSSDAPKPVFVRVFEYPQGYVGHTHRHRPAQVVYPIRGVVSVETRSGTWVVGQPPRWRSRRGATTASRRTATHRCEACSSTPMRIHSSCTTSRASGSARCCTS